MRPWKDRGYVPDSDGEEDEQRSFSTAQSSESLNHHAAQTTKSHTRGPTIQYYVRHNGLGRLDNTGYEQTSDIRPGPGANKVISVLRIDL